MLFAQSEIDAYRFSQTDLNGTARSMSMGGAFGGLGGDMSVMSHNPAGMSVYRSSEVQTTLNLSMANMESAWTGVNTSQNRTRFNIDNMSYITYFPTGVDTGVKGWNFGFSYNRVKNFYRTYRAVGNPKYSMADYTAARTTNAYEEKDGFRGIPENDLIGTDSYDPYENADLGGHWLSVLGYQSGFIGLKYKDKWNDVYHSGFGQYDGSGIWNPASPSAASMNIRESGWISEYNFSASMNISDRFFIGATLGVSDINYRMFSQHEEQFGGGDYLYLENTLETDGTGYSINLGVLFRPVNAFRFGIAYNSPKWYNMTDYAIGKGESYIKAYSDNPKMYNKTPDGGIFEYAYRSPDRWIFSAAGIIGTSALISIDYELTNYSSMRLGNRNYEYFNDITEQAKRDFKVGHTLKVGAEYKITPQFAIRAGYVWQPTPMKETLTSGDMEVFTAGTVPHYTTTTGTTNYYTVGLGYRFTPNFFMDLACIYRTQKQELYPFSSVFIENPEFHIRKVFADAAKVTGNTTRLALTIGYKF